MGAHIGNKHGRGNSNSGRKPKSVEIAGIIKGIEEEITMEALVKLASSRVFNEITTNKSYNAIKDLSLPVTLKAMKEQSTVTLLTPKPLDNMEDILRPEEIKPELAKS